MGIARVGAFFGLRGVVPPAPIMLLGPWALVLGIGVDLHLDRPVPVFGLMCAMVLCAAGLVLIRNFSPQRERWFGVIVMAMFFLAGMGIVQLRAHMVASPRIQTSERVWRVKGVVENVDRDTGQRMRILLDVRRVDGLEPQQTPAKIRFGSLSDPVSPGDVIEARVRLMPPPQPAFPGAYDAARQAWFAQIGAVGFAYGHVRVVDTVPMTGLRVRINQLRHWVVSKVRKAPNGAIATALLTGDRSFITPGVQQQFRQSGLGHLLAISGLHMSLVGGLVYVCMSMFFASIPAIGTSMDARKPAAIVGLVFAFGYMLLSGASAPTQRAFIMLALMFMAVITGRRALSIRTISMAAFVIAILQPEYVVQAGFQMSFAAALALVAFYQRFERYLLAPEKVTSGGLLRKSWRFLVGIWMTSLIAGLATAPFAAWHFHRVALYTLLANLLAMPVFVILVMPPLFLALLAMLFGWQLPFLDMAGWGLSWVQGVAAWVSALPGATMPVAGSNDWVLLFYSLALLAICLSIGKLWKISTMLGLVAVLLQITSPHAIGFVDPQGVVVVGNHGHESRLYVLGKPNKFALEQFHDWVGAQNIRILKRGGDQTDGAMHCDALGCSVTIAGHVIVWRQGEEDLETDCANADMIVLSGTLPARKAPACSGKKVVSASAQSGHFIMLNRSGPYLQSRHPARLWSAHQGDTTPSDTGA